MMMRVLIAGLWLFAANGLTHVYAQAPNANPLIGTWKMNRERSCAALEDCDQQLTMRFQESENGFFSYVHSRLNEDGNPTFVVGAFKFDGQTYAWYRHTDVLTLLTTEQQTPITRRWTRTGEFVFSAEAGTFGTLVYTVSEDGREIIQTRVSPEGVDLQDAVYFDRVD